MFIGAGSIVLPDVIIEDNTIIGAGSIVTKSLLGGGVFVGNPAKKICEYEEWINKQKSEIKRAPKFDESYQIGNITEEKKDEMKEKLEKGIGYIV